MTDKQKTKQELIQELDLLRQKVADLEQSELARKRAEETLGFQARIAVVFSTVPDDEMFNEGQRYGVRLALLQFEIVGQWTSRESREILEREVSAEPSYRSYPGGFVSCRGGGK